MAILGRPYRFLYSAKNRRTGLVDIRVYVMRPDSSIIGPYVPVEFSHVRFKGIYTFWFNTNPALDEKGEYVFLVESPTEGISVEPLKISFEKTDAYVDVSPTSIQDIANKVWDEKVNVHLDTGSFGKYVNDSLYEILDIQGDGFNSSNHSLSQVAVKVSQAKSSADIAANEATQARLVSETRATQGSVDEVRNLVSEIPTNPVLETDLRISHLDANISSRVSSSAFEQILGTNFNPTTNSLKAIADAIQALNNGDATKANQVLILNAIQTLATQARLNDAIAAIMNIPTQTLLNSDPRLNCLDALISSRASEFGLLQIQGPNFDALKDNLRNIRILIENTPSPSQEILDELKRMQGQDFNDNRDSLKEIRETDHEEHSSIKADTESLLSTGKPI